MKDFDDKRQHQLRILIEKRVNLHFPFFANTFSLAYHYANGLRCQSGPQGWGETKRLLYEHKWEDPPIPKLIENESNVFYSTAAGFEDLSSSESGSRWDLTSVPFTRYKPLWIFADFRAFLKSDQDPAYFSPKVAAIISAQKPDHIELLTDIPSQSTVICRHLASWGLAQKINVLREPADALVATNPREKVLRLYFYGAPATTRMLGEPRRFIPFRIPEKVDWDDKTSITTICLAAPKGTWAATEKADFCTFAKDYHDCIFEAAEPRHHTDLLNVWWAYNRFAERKQHSSIFQSPEIFAKCLREHHAPV